MSVGLEADNVVDLVTESDVGMSEDGNHLYHCVIVDLKADNVVDLVTESGEVVGTDNTAGIVGTVVDVWVSPMGWNHCIHDDLDTVEAISR